MAWRSVVALSLIQKDQHISLDATTSRCPRGAAAIECTAIGDFRYEGGGLAQSWTLFMLLHVLLSWRWPSDVQCRFLACSPWSVLLLAHFSV